MSQISNVKNKAFDFYYEFKDNGVSKWREGDKANKELIEELKQLTPLNRREFIENHIPEQFKCWYIQQCIKGVNK